MRQRIAIVGGGIAGLSAAEALERSGFAPVVLEADTTPGGKIRSHKVRGCVVETGPHGFLDKEPKMKALIARLGLESSVIRANDRADTRWIVRNGQLCPVPTTPPAFLASNILPTFAKMRVLAEPFIPDKVTDEEESVHEFASRRIGREASLVLVDAMVTGIYGGDPRQLSLSAAFPRMAELEAKYGSLFVAQLELARDKKRAQRESSASTKKSAVGAPAGTLHSFDKGLGVLIDALARRTEIRYGVQVVGIEKRSTGFNVRMADGQSIDVQGVVLTSPTDVSMRLLSGLTTNAHVLGHVPYAPIAVVVHAFPSTPFAKSLDGFGFLAPEIEKRRILGSIFASTVFSAHAPEGIVMTRTLLGGARHPEHARGDLQELSHRALEELGAILGVRLPNPLLTEVFRWERAIPQYNLGHGSIIAAADAIESQIPGIILGGNGLRGVAMIQCVADAERIATKMRAALPAA